MAVFWQNRVFWPFKKASQTISDRIFLKKLQKSDPKKAKKRLLEGFFGCFRLRRPIVCTK